MKYSLICLCLLFVMGACNDSSTTNEEPTPNQTNVQNVNGNLPDTSGGMNLNSTQEIDSSNLKDSTRK